VGKTRQLTKFVCVRNEDSLCFRSRINQPFHSIHVYCVRSRRELYKFSIMGLHVEQGEEVCRLFEHLTNRSQVECRATEQCVRTQQYKIKKKKFFFPHTAQLIPPLFVMITFEFSIFLNFCFYVQKSHSFNGAAATSGFSLSHVDTLHSVGLICKTHLPDAKAST